MELESSEGGVGGCQDLGILLDGYRDLRREWVSHNLIVLNVHPEDAETIVHSKRSVTVFGPLLVKSIGYTSLRASLLLTPGGATTCISIYIFALLASSRRLSRTVPYFQTILLVLSCLPPIIGAIMCWKGNWANKAVPLAGYYLLPTFGAPFVLLLGWSTANVQGGTKQAISSAAIFLGYNLVRSVSSGFGEESDRQAKHSPALHADLLVGKHCRIIHPSTKRSKTSLPNDIQNRHRRHVRNYRGDVDYLARHEPTKQETRYRAVRWQSRRGPSGGSRV